jgi:hypothetical protein
VIVTIAFAAAFGVALTAPAPAQAVAPGAGMAQAAPAEAAAPAAAGWLARQLVDGNHLETTFGGTSYPDQGLTADAVLAFDAAGVAQDAAAAAAGWLAGDTVLPAYVGDGDTESYPGALAKISLVALAQGADPAAFGGVDLIARLRARQDGASGRFSDKSQYGDFSNAITQSLAIIALLRSGSSAAELAKPVDFLQASRCQNGGFPLQFGAATCASDVDATSYVVQALLAAGRDVSATLDFLQDVQDTGGGFRGSGPTNVVNANSTGIAAQALRAGGRGDPADDAVAFLARQQVGCTGPAQQRGAIAYDDKGFDAGSAPRATAEALYGLTGVGLAEIDNSGATAEAPTLDCTPPATATTTTAATSSAASVHGSATGAGELAATGARPVPVAVLGALLVLAGMGTLRLARRRARP